MPLIWEKVFSFPLSSPFLRKPEKTNQNFNCQPKLILPLRAPSSITERQISRLASQLSSRQTFMRMKECLYSFKRLITFSGFMWKFSVLIDVFRNTKYSLTLCDPINTILGVKIVIQTRLQILSLQLITKPNDVRSYLMFLINLF